MENANELGAIVPTNKKKLTLQEFTNYPKCPYLYYGNSKASLDLFWCDNCSMYVCDFCLFECHNKDCLKSKNPPKTNFFVSENCDCGKEGHINRKKDQTLD